MNIQSIEHEPDADAIEVPGADPAIAKALEAIDAAKALRAGIVAKVSRLEGELSTAENSADLASLLAEGGDPTGQGIYADALASVAQITSDLARAKRATAIAKSKIYDAKVAFHAVAKAGLVRKFEQLTAQRAKAADRVLETERAHAEARAAFKSISDRISYALPHSLQQRTGGLLLRPTEIASALPSFGPESKDRVHLEFVGLNGTFGQNVALANSVILARVEAGPDRELDDDLPEVIEDNAAPSGKYDATKYVPPKKRIEL
jgi:hypothetical protein